MAWIDTLLSAFKGGEADRVPLASGFASGMPVDWLHSFATRAPEPFEYTSAVRQSFLSNPIAQRAVRIIAEGVAQAPLTSSQSAVLSLVKATSAGQPLIETLATHLLLHGNGYVQIIKDASGKPVELFALRPDRVKIVADEHGWPCAVEYTVGANKRRIAFEDEDGWPNLIQIKTMHPLEDHYGASALAAAHQAVRIHNAASTWNRALLDNASRPSGALVYDPADGATLTDDQFDRLKSELTSAFAGSVNAGRPMLLDGGLKWQRMAYSPADMDFATLKARLRARWPSPLASPRCCLVCRATTRIPIIAKPTKPCGGSRSFRWLISCLERSPRVWIPGSRALVSQWILIALWPSPKIAKDSGNKSLTRNF